jgi:hypothetical protein
MNTATAEQTAYDALVAAEAAHGPASPEFFAAYKALRAAREARAAANPRTTPHRSGPSGP